VNEIRKKSIAETLRIKIQTPWVWLVFVLTICLTALFYVSQKPQVAVYSQYVKSLCDYQYAEASLMRSMERVRSGLGVDSSVVIAQIMTLREVAFAFKEGVVKLKKAGFSAPPPAMVSHFEKNVQTKVSCLRLYLSERAAWLDELADVYHTMDSLSMDKVVPVVHKLDSAKAGFAVSSDFRPGLPLPVALRVEKLLRNNLDLYNAWKQFDNDMTLSASDELLHFFQMENLKEISLSGKIPLAFYFLSLVLLLATFFFLFKSKE